MEDSEEVLIDRVEDRAFGVLAPAFRDDNKWRLESGGNTIDATVEDVDFLARVDSVEELFGKGDVLLSDVHFRQVKTANGLKDEYSILRVKEHRRSARQVVMKLPPQRANPAAQKQNRPPPDSAQAAAPACG